LTTRRLGDSPRDGKFGLKVTNRPDGLLDVRLVLLGKLDRESRDQYHLRLTAFDGGIPSRSDSVNITVNVMDSNDNDPVFDASLYEATIVENTPINQVCMYLVFI